MTITSREVRFASRPEGLPTEANFSLDEVRLAPLEEGRVLVRNRFMSVDPYMRGRMNAGKSYAPGFELGKALSGGAVGEVVESKVAGLRPGDFVVSELGWREYFSASLDQLKRIDHPVQPLSVHLGALGMTGMTAWIGLRLGECRPGETVFVSGAAGAVGSVAGQLAKIMGCRVIGTAGSDAKLSFLRDECGFDAAINYKAGALLEKLTAAAPDGIDLYFDNVGGDCLEAALSALRLHGRIVACGSISGYNAQRPLPGPTNLFRMITQRLTMKGMIVRDWLNQTSEFEAEAGALLRAGKLKNKETVVRGIDKAVGAFLGLFHGDNTGKMIVRLD
jgi:NADPH-dependent curcumin reductase CurA